MAYLLDTNVISELRKRRTGRASPHVLAWFESVAQQELFLSVLVLGELRRGIERRRGRDPQTAAALDRWFDTIKHRYRDRALPVTAKIAACWGQLCPNQPLPVIDGLLAATALENDWTLVTRNIDDVIRSGVRVLNPFTWPIPGNGGREERS